MLTGNRFFKIAAVVTIVAFGSSSTGLAYTPAELNPLLGRPVLLDITTCIQKYGEEFCACVQLEEGGTGCYYKRPAPGFYSLERCEQIWGKGYCECPQTDMCQLRQDANEGNPVGCSGQIFIFPGEAEDCHKAGPRTNWRDCCESSDATSSSCSFRNLAKKLGWDDAAIALAEAAALHYTKKELASVAGQIAVEQAIKNGAFDFATTSIGSIFGAGAPAIAEQGGSMVIEYAGQTFATQSAELAAEYIAGAFLACFNFIMWAYAIYQMYSMYDELTKCTAAEKILSCKRAKGVCHEVGTRCSWKAFGTCLQSKKVYCCYDSVLARIIHEQGRPQLGMDFGNPKDPLCRGFYMDEFMRLDFTRMDFGEYVDDLTRQMLNPAKVESKVRSIVEKYATEMGAME